MSLIGKLLKPVTSLFKPPPPPPTETHAIQGDRYDTLTWEGLLKQAPGLRDAVKELAQGAPVLETLAEDAFRSVYRPTARLEDPARLDPAYRPNHALLDALMQSDDWKTLRKGGTEYNDLASAIAARALCQHFAQTLTPAQKEEISQAGQPQPQVDARLERVKALMRDVAQKGTAAHLSGDARGEALYQHQYARLERMLQELMHEQGAAAAAVGEQLTEGEAGSKLRNAAAAAAHDAQAAIDEVAAAEELFGGGGGWSPAGAGGGSSLSLDEKLKLMERLHRSEIIRQLMQYAGRFVRLAMAMQARKVEHQPDEVADVELGGDLNLILSEELMLVRHPKLGQLAKLDLIEERMLQLRVHGTEKKGRGDIIVPIDNSGSMGAEVAHGMTREGYAKALALALVKIAQKQKRALTILHYGMETDAAQVTEFRFLPGEANRDKLIAALEYFQGGGTRYEGWMRRSVQVLGGQRFAHADIIHLSDGLCHVPDDVLSEFNGAIAANGARVVSIMIGDEGGHWHGARRSGGSGGGEPHTVLHDFSHSVINVQDLEAAMGAAGEVFSL